MGRALGGVTGKGVLMIMMAEIEGGGSDSLWIKRDREATEDAQRTEEEKRKFI